MLRFPDCNQYLRKNLSKVFHQSPPKATEIWKKALWPGFQKTPILQERTFQQMCSKRPPNKTSPPLHLDSLFSSFSRLAGPCRPDTPKRYLLHHFAAKIIKIIHWFTIWCVFVASFLFAYMCMRIISACILVHLLSPFVGYVFPTSCYQRQSSRMMCKTGWCGDATPQASSI